MSFSAARYPFLVKEAKSEAESFLGPVEDVIQDIEAAAKELGSKTTTKNPSADEVTIASSSYGVIMEAAVFINSNPPVALDFDVLIPIFKKHQFQVK